MARKNAEAERLIRELGALKLSINASTNATLQNADQNANKLPRSEGLVSSLLPSSYFGQTTSHKNEAKKTSATKPPASIGDSSHDVVQRCHAISQLLSNQQFRVAIIHDRQNNAILISAVEILLQCCHAENANVRLAAEEALSRLLLCYGKTHTVSLLIEFFKEIRKNGPPRALKTALKCFELLCAYVNPQKMKCRTLLFHLSQTAVKICRRDEEAVQEAIGTALPRAFSVLGQFATEQETKAVLKTFFTLLGDDNGVKRRASGLCMVSVCCSCRMSTDMAEWLIRGLINMLTSNKTQVSFTLVLGTLTCIRYWLLALPHLLNENANAAKPSFVTSARRNINRSNNSAAANSNNVTAEAPRQRLENAFLTVTFLLLVYLRHDHFNVVTHCLEALTACVGVDVMRNDFERLFARPGAVMGIGLPLLMLESSSNGKSQADDLHGSKPGSIISGGINNNGKFVLDMDQQSLTSLNVVDQTFDPVIKRTAAGLRVDADVSTTNDDDKIADMNDFNDDSLSGVNVESYTNIDEITDRVSISDEDDEVEEDEEAVIWKRQRDELDSAGAVETTTRDRSATITGAVVSGNDAVVDAGEARPKISTVPPFDIKIEHDQLFKHFNGESDNSPSALVCLANILLDSFLYSADTANSSHESTNHNQSAHLFQQHPAGKKASVRHLSLSLLCRILQQMQQFAVVSNKTGAVSGVDEEIEIYSSFLTRACDVVMRIIPVPPLPPTEAVDGEDDADPLLVGYSCQCLAAIAAGKLAVEQMRCVADKNMERSTEEISEAHNFFDSALLTVVRQCLTNRSSITCRYALQALCRLLQCAVAHPLLMSRAVTVLNRLMPVLITPLSTSKQPSTGTTHDDVEAADDSTVMPGATAYWLCRIEWLKGLASLPLALLNVHDSFSSSVALSENGGVLPSVQQQRIDEADTEISPPAPVSVDKNFAKRLDEIVDDAMNQCRLRNETLNLVAADQQSAGAETTELGADSSTIQESAVKLTPRVSSTDSKQSTNLTTRRLQLADFAMDSCLTSLCSDDVRVRDAAAAALNTLIITSSLKYIAGDDARNAAQWKCSQERAEPFTSLHSGHLFPYPICTSLYADLPASVVSAALARCVHVLKAHAYESGGLDDLQRLDGTFAALAALCQEYSPLSHAEAWFGFSTAVSSSINLDCTAQSPKQQKKAALAAVIGQKQLLTLGAKEANDMLRYCLHLLNQTRACADIRLHRNVLIFASHYMIALFLRITTSSTPTTLNNKMATNAVSSNKLSATENESDELNDDAESGTTYHKQLERKLDVELAEQIQLLKGTVKRMFHHLLCLEYMLESVIGGYQHFSAAVLKRNEALKRSLAETVRHVAVISTSKLVESGAAIIGEAETVSSARKTTTPKSGVTNSQPVGMMQSFSNMFSRTRSTSSTSSGGGGKDKANFIQSGKTNFASSAAAAGGSGDASPTPPPANAALLKPTEAVFEKLYESLRKAYARYLANAGEALLSSASSANGTTTTILLNTVNSDSSGRSRGNAGGNLSAASQKFPQFVGSTLSCLRLVTEIIDKEPIVNNLQTIVKSVTSLMLIEPELCIDYSSSLLRKLFGLTATSNLVAGPAADAWLVALMDNRSYGFADTRHQCDVHPLDAAGDQTSDAAASLVRVGFLTREQEKSTAAVDDDVRGDFTFYTLCDKVQVLSQLNSRWKEDLDLLFRHQSSKHHQQSHVAIATDRARRQELSNQIRTFESVVIRAMQLYTCTGDASTQVKVLSFISLLLKLRVNYSVLDGEHILLEFVIKQIESADGAGHIQRFERLVPAIFHFLLLLSREQHHVSHTSVNMSKVIQLLDVLMAAELPNVTGDLIRQIVFLFYKETVRRLLHARATLGASSLNNNTQHWQQIAEQLETEKEYLHSIILRLVSTHTSLYVLAFMLESMKNGDLTVNKPPSSSHNAGDLSTLSVLSGNSNAAAASLGAYRATAGLVFELAMGRLLRGDIDLGNSVTSFCSLDYFFHVMPDELFRPPDSLLCQVFSLSSSAMLSTTTSPANSKRRPSVITSSAYYAAAESSWNFSRPDDSSASESSVLAMQVLKFFILKTLFERNTSTDMRNGIADWWHSARGIIALDADSSNDDDIAVSSFLKLYIFDDGLRQSACGAIRTLCLGSGVHDPASSSVTKQLPPLSTCYLRLFIAQCSLLRYLTTKNLQHSQMLSEAIQSDSAWFGGFFVHLCGVLLQSICAVSPVPVLSVHVPALQALCTLLGSLWPMLVNNEEVSNRNWSEQLQSLFVAADLEPQIVLNCFERLVVHASKTAAARKKQIPNDDTRFADDFMQLSFSQLITYVCTRMPLELLVYSKTSVVMDKLCHVPQNLLRISQSVVQLLCAICGTPHSEHAPVFPTTAVSRLLQLISGALAANKISANKDVYSDFEVVALDVCGCLCCTPSCPLFLTSMAASTFENLVQTKKLAAASIDLRRVRSAYDCAVRVRASTIATDADLSTMVNDRCPVLFNLLSAGIGKDST